MERSLPVAVTRRGFVVCGAAALAGTAMVPQAASALDLNSARALIDRAITDVNSVINSGKAEAAMYKDFEKIFARYADVPTIARSALGVAARSASSSQMSAFTKAYQAYIGRKYGKRFREFIGGRIEVVDARPLKSYFEVISVAHLKGEAPFDLRWHVSNKSGKDLFFNIIIEGVNMLASERQEIGAMLDRRKGDINALIGDLNAS
ncbi:ABC transporter substrate-binding protein [Aliigemmobacter aestuarii]|uniref:ABC transporter substrate-binding protein n=1 Tax=Aliigemmobacter aestuarii TaxID=1445661 RepID=A0A4S3MS92_9RHOB|nr:ABC transporter substrate-binding protein [Gemmobacter aestuarii]